MRCILVGIILVLLCGESALLGAADFSRYAVILSRRPFGTPVEEVAPPPPVSTAPPAFVQQLRMVGITESPAGIRVGLVNTGVRPPRTYFLYVGDQEDGFLLSEADYDRERALVIKDGEQYWLRMGMGGDAEGGDDKQATASTGIMHTEKPASSRAGVIRSGAAQVTRTESQDSYADRRRQRLEEMRKKAEESRQLSEEEVERQLREYQMKLIREGRTPLPIPITEEMDQQLVKEGILPAVE